MRSASPPRDGPDSNYDGNKRQTTHTRLPPTTAHTVCLYPALLYYCNTFKTCLMLHFSVSLLREPLNTHTGTKRARTRYIALSKPTGWRQIIFPFVLFSPSFLFFSLFNTRATQLATTVNLTVSIY